MQQREQLLAVPGRLPREAVRWDLRTHKFRHVTGIHYYEADQLDERSSLLRLEQKMLVPRELRGSYQVFDPNDRMNRLILLACEEGSVWATRRPLDEADWKKALRLARRLTRGGRRRQILPSRPEFRLEEFSIRADRLESGMIFVSDGNRTTP